MLDLTVIRKLIFSTPRTEQQLTIEREALEVVNKYFYCDNEVIINPVHMSEAIKKLTKRNTFLWYSDRVLVPVSRRMKACNSFILNVLTYEAEIIGIEEGLR